MGEVIMNTGSTALVLVYFSVDYESISGYRQLNDLVVKKNWHAAKVW